MEIDRLCTELRDLNNLAAERGYQREHPVMGALWAALCNAASDDPSPAYIRNVLKRLTETNQ